MVEVPLGKCESEVLELKGRDALKDRRSLARAVVAFLNSEGGDLWVGIREEGGRAASLEPIPDADREREALIDSLADTIEPSPRAGEIRIDTVTMDEGDVLRVTVSQGSHGPYAHLASSGGRYYLSRLASRVRPMTREQLRRAFQESEEPCGRPEQVKRRVLEERERLQKLGEKRIWMQIAPVEELEIDIEAEELRELLEAPEASGNRRAGRVVVGYGEIELRDDGLVLRWPPRHWGPEETYRRETEIRKDGTITYTAPLDALLGMPSPGATQEERQRRISPLALIELPVSLMRLSAHVYEPRLAGESRLWADLALVGFRGMKLRPSRSAEPWKPGRTRHDVFTGGGEFPEDDFTLLAPLELTVGELFREPDRCAFRLVRLVYEAFGYPEEAIPPEFDRKAGRLMLSE